MAHNLGEKPHQKPVSEKSRQVRKTEGEVGKDGAIRKRRDRGKKRDFGLKGGGLSWGGRVLRSKVKVVQEIKRPDVGEGQGHRKTGGLGWASPNRWHQ